MAKSKPTPAALPRHLAPLLLLALAVLVFYWEPLTSSQASIQWDAVDVHYTAQRYFAEMVRQGQLPEWVPYIYSGYPFLADPQVGAWYPLNWPFFLLGVTPAAIQAELALHALIAALGAYFFAFLWTRERISSGVAAMAYAFSGFFAGHASHVGMFQGAAWLPVILLALERALASGSMAWMTAGGVAVGVAALAGHFQTSIYTGFVVAVYGAWLVATRRPPAVRVAMTAAGFALFPMAIAAAVVLPGLTLLDRSVRLGMSFGGATNSPLVPAALGTLLWPNALGALEPETYRGPADITQYYLYAGLLLVPLAVGGFVKSSLRWAALVLVVPAIWYSLGPGYGLYAVLAKLPGLGSVRAPVHLWFVVALGLALAAAGGVAVLAERWKSRLLLVVVAGFVFVDLWYWNSLANPLAYGRHSFAEGYGNKLAEFQMRLGSQLPELMRFHAERPLGAFGPQNHPVDARVATTYGYNPLELRTYSEFMAAAARNPKLMDELGAQFRLDREQGGVVKVDTAMPRVTIPPKVSREGDLASHDPRESALGNVSTQQDVSGTVTVAGHGPGYYQIRSRLQSPSLLRIAEVWYPGWEATVNGKAAEVVAVDGALMGVVAPAGEAEVILRFRLDNLRLGLGISFAALALGVTVLIWKRRELLVGFD